VRRNTAKEKGISAFVILHDSDWKICASSAIELAGVRRVSGFGEKKVEMYGKNPGRPPPLPPGRTRHQRRQTKSLLPGERNLRLLVEGRTFEEIAQIRSRTLRAVVSLVAT